jgi:hypothetical protein
MMGADVGRRSRAGRCGNNALREWSERYTRGVSTGCSERVGTAGTGGAGDFGVWQRHGGEGGVEQAKLEGGIRKFVLTRARLYTWWQEGSRDIQGGKKRDVLRPL